MLFHNIELDRWEVWTVVRAVDYDTDYEENDDWEAEPKEIGVFTRFGEWIIEFHSVFPQKEREAVLQECEDLISGAKHIPEPYFFSDSQYYYWLRDYEKKMGRKF